MSRTKRITEMGRSSNSKVSKESVDYSPGMRARHCAVCSHYDEPGLCELVRGKIDPEYWCRLFRKESNG